MAQWLTEPTGWELAIFAGLKALFRPANSFLDSLPPHAWHLAAVGLFALAGICAFFVPRGYVYGGAPDNARWRDLRIWAMLTLLPYMAIYYFL